MIAAITAWLTGSKYGPWVLLAIALLTAGLIYRSKLIQQGLEEAERRADQAARERRNQVDGIREETRGMTAEEIDEEMEPWIRR